MRQFSVIYFFIALIVFASPSGAQTPQTPKSVIAEALFRQGKSLMRNGKFQQACEKFTASHQIDPALGTLLNLADCLEKDGKTASAWSKYSDAIAPAIQNRDRNRESFARARLKKLEPKLLRATVVVSHPLADLSVTLDGNLLPREAWGTALPVDPGLHQLEVRAKGRKTWFRSMTIDSANRLQQWEVPLLEEEPVVVILPSSAESGKPTGLQPEVKIVSGKKAWWDLSRREWGYVLDASGAALLVGGFVSDMMAESAYSDAKKASDPHTFDNAKSSFRTRAAVANILYGAGAAALGTGLYFTFYGGGSDAKVAVTVVPDSRGGTLTFSGEF